MRQLSITKSSKPKDGCPICQRKVTDEYTNRLNTVDGCITTYKGKCRKCEISLTKIDGEWKTSWLTYDSMLEEQSIGTAYKLFGSDFYDNPITRKEFSLPEDEFKQLSEGIWNEFLDTMRPNDRIFTWKNEDSHGLALCRGTHVIDLIRFD